MRFEDDIKLDFSDVLMKPKRSTLSSRNDVDLLREFKNPDGSTWECVPIVAANMDTVGTFEMANKLSKHKCLTALHKHYSVDELVEFYSQNDTSYVFYSMGTSDTDIEKLNTILDNHSDTVHIDKLCIDVANGYSMNFLEKVKYLRGLLPNAFILAGNVVTPEMTEELIVSGVDCVKVGIGSGCFHPDSEVKTDRGYKKIKDVEIGDMVLTHLGEAKPVTNIFSYDDKRELMTINGIKCTPNHEFYVVNISDIHKINDDNYQKYSYWVSAVDLDEKKHKLVEII